MDLSDRISFVQPLSPVTVGEQHSTRISSRMDTSDPGGPPSPLSSLHPALLLSHPQRPEAERTAHAILRREAARVQREIGDADYKGRPESRHQHTADVDTGARWSGKRRLPSYPAPPRGFDPLYVSWISDPVGWRRGRGSFTFKQPRRQGRQAVALYVLVKSGLRKHPHPPLSLSLSLGFIDRAWSLALETKRSTGGGLGGEGVRIEGERTGEK